MKKNPKTIVGTKSSTYNKILACEIIAKSNRKVFLLGREI
jgi:hypothetical protein